MRDSVRSDLADNTLPSDLTKIMAEVSSIYGVQVENPKLFKGEVDRNVRFDDANHGKLLLKVSAGTLDGEILRWQETVLRAVANDPIVTFETPTILPALNGNLHVRIGGHLVRVITWISGLLWNENIRAGGGKATLMHSLGEASARLTIALSNVEMPPNVPGHDWMIERGPFGVRRALEQIGQAGAAPSERLSIIQHIADQFEKEVLPQLADLPWSVIHHDLHDGNVILDSTGYSVAGVIDFNDAVFAPRVTDLAISGAYAMLGQHSPEEAFRSVVAGYQNVLELDAQEVSVVGKMALMRLCMNWAQWQARALESTDNEYALSRSAHTWPLIDYLAETGPPTV